MPTKKVYEYYCVLCHLQFFFSVVFFFVTMNTEHNNSSQHVQIIKLPIVNFCMEVKAIALCNFMWPA